VGGLAAPCSAQDCAAGQSDGGGTAAAAADRARQLLSADRVARHAAM
jgi:hypothetical protein